MLEYIRDGLISTNQQNYRISNEITSPTNFSSFFKYLLRNSHIENYIAHYFNRNMFMNYINHIRDANQMKPVAMLAGFVSNKDKNIADQFFESLKVSMPFIKLNFSIEFYEHLMSDWFFERFYNYVEETLKVFPQQAPKAPMLRPQICRSHHVHYRHTTQLNHSFSTTSAACSCPRRRKQR